MKPLLLAALILAALASIAADEPPPRPFTVEGKVEVETRKFDLGFGEVMGRAYFLRAVTPIAGRERVSLTIWADEHYKVLDRAAAEHSTVRIRGFWTEVNGHPFLTVRSIEERKP